MAKQHARYSPSTLDSLTKCLRFRYNETNDDAANEGTELHKAFETGNLAGLNDEQKLAVTKARDYVATLKISDGGPGMWSDLSEERVELKGLTFGTADRVLINRTAGVFHVIDAKFGRLSSDHDMQVRTYAAALYEKLAAEDPEKQWTANTHVVAPRLNLIDHQAFDAAELYAEIRQQIVALYARLDDPFLPPTPHEDLCAKCARASKCPALGIVVREAASCAGLPVPATFAPNALVSEKDRAIAQVLAGALINWGEQVKKLNAEYVQQGGSIEGFKLVTRSNGLRVAQEHTTAAVAALTVSGISQDLILDNCTLSIPKLAQAWADQQGTDAADAKDHIRSVLGELAQEGSSAFLQKQKRISDNAQLALLLNP